METSAFNESDLDTLFDLPPLQSLSEERIDVLEKQQGQNQKIFETHRIELCTQKEELTKLEILLKSLYVVSLLFPYLTNR